MESWQTSWRGKLTIEKGVMPQQSLIATVSVLTFHQPQAKNKQQQQQQRSPCRMLKVVATELRWPKFTVSSSNADSNVSFSPHLRWNRTQPRQNTSSTGPDFISQSRWSNRWETPAPKRGEGGGREGRAGCLPYPPAWSVWLRRCDALCLCLSLRRGKNKNNTLDFKVRLTSENICTRFKFISIMAE